MTHPVAVYSRTLVQSKTIQGGGDGPHLLITGGVHGDEFEPMAALRRLLKLIDPSSLRGKLTVVPVANEAAFIRGTRTAEDELDLARTCPGSAEGSITERTAYALCELIRSADYYIDLHTGGIAMSVFPLAGYQLVPDATIRDTQRRMAEAFNLPLVWGTDYRLEGRTLSVARDAKIPAIYAEYMGCGLCEPDGIEAYVDGCLNVMAHLGMLHRDPMEPRVERVVEDFRVSAGHMQVCNPAAMDGFFEPRISLGDRIEAGQSLGTIADVLGDTVVTVPSQQTGTIIVLRSFSRIRQGETVAVVLEDDTQ